MAKLAVTPPVVGSVRTTRYSRPASPWRRTAHVTFAICMSEVTPSCMRAPPDTVNPTTGRRLWVARSKQRQILSPTALPMEPIMNEESITNSAQRSPDIVASPVTTASRSWDFTCAAASFWR